ncbi:MAG TPA: C4-type zinc ribbon domain-containing protein [Ktedonobacteraceae bacterium]|jgi:predicted  nucleic acid-binding Zn-ribbon protein|nr:C4-type zinc ribbon domain-containing protein [Ktedonobacteraceae bacterium]
MSTTKIAASLYQLQRLDLELERLIAEQQALEISLKGDSALKKLRTEHTIAQQQLHLGLQAQKEAEWALEELDRRMRMQEQRLYSGVVTNPKELYALQQEVQHLRAQQNRQEEMALEVILTTESLQETANSKAEDWRQAQEKWLETNAAGMIRRDQLDMQRQELLENREQFVSAIDVQVLNRYEALKRTKQGRAVSKVDQNSCQWCRVILTPSELQRVRANTDLQMCSNCGRILYYDR